MHQVRGAPDLDVTLQRRLREGVDQPPRVGVADQPVPLAANDRDRYAHLCWIVRELPVPRLDDIAERPERYLDAGRIARPAGRVAVQVGLAPLLEMNPRQHRWLAVGHIFDEALPL